MRQGRHRGRQRHARPRTTARRSTSTSWPARPARPPARCASSSRSRGLKKLPTDIWIDASQRVRRQTVAIDVKQPLPIKFSLQIDYKRFGVPVDVQAPPAAETVDYSAVAAAAERPRAALGAGGEALLGDPKLGWGACATRPSSTPSTCPAPASARAGSPASSATSRAGCRAPTGAARRGGHDERSRARAPAPRRAVSRADGSRRTARARRAGRRRPRTPPPARRP